MLRLLSIRYRSPHYVTDFTRCFKPLLVLLRTSFHTCTPSEHHYNPSLDWHIGRRQRECLQILRNITRRRRLDEENGDIRSAKLVQHLHSCKCTIAMRGRVRPRATRREITTIRGAEKAPIWAWRNASGRYVGSS